MSVAEKWERALRGAFHSSLGELFWYAVMAASAWMIFYVVFRSALRHRRISTQDPTTRQILREIQYSLRSIAIFGLVTIGIIFAAYSGWTKFYRNIDDYGWAWYAASIALMIFIHDTYFYWTHRLMHHRRLYRFFHHTHHLSTSPTPWAAYAFSPAEALVQAGVAPVIIFTMPIHPTAFATFMLWQISFNVLGHCGYEAFPGWFVRSPFGCIMNTVTHHAMHHEKFKSNYGLYFNIWDRLMGTNHAEYENRFAKATSGATHV